MKTNLCIGSKTQHSRIKQGKEIIIDDEISDLTGLSNFSNIGLLQLNAYNSNDLTEISNISNLNKLNINCIGEPITDISILNGTDLKEISISNYYSWGLSF